MISPVGGAYNGVPGRLCGSDAKDVTLRRLSPLGDERPWGWSLCSLAEAGVRPSMGYREFLPGKRLRTPETAAESAARLLYARCCVLQNPTGRMLAAQSPESNPSLAGVEPVSVIAANSVQERAWRGQRLGRRVSGGKATES